MKDAYKPLFCAPSFYTEHQDCFKIIDETLGKLHWDKTSEVMLWTSLLCLLRRPNNWYGGTFCLNDSSSHSGSLYPHFAISTLTEKLNISWPKKLSTEISLYDFLKTVRIKPLPAVAQKAMFYIFSKKYPVTILDYEPTPAQLLQIQCEGRRIITFKNDYQNWPTQMFGARDPLSFWLHDCIHAEHFFAQPEHFISQLGFYKFVALATEKNCWDRPTTAEFNDDFSYLISDMNSHPLHLFKTLKAITDIHFKAESVGIWDTVIAASTGSTEELNALRKINTAYFCDKDYDALLQLTKRLGAQSYMS